MQDATYTIVVLDDDDALRGAIRHWGERLGYRIHTVATAEEARAIVAEKQVDLALLDIRLPDADGIALAESLIEADPERPVLLMTAYADLDSARRAIGIGVFEFFSKPISFEALGVSFARALQHRERLIGNRLRHTSELKEINADLTREIGQRREGERNLAEQTRTLAEANTLLLQKDRLLTAYQGIAKIALSSLNMEEIVDSVGRQLIEARVFQSLMMALVDEDSRRIKVVKQIHQQMPTEGGDPITHLLGDVDGYSLDEPNVVALVARTGEMKVVDESENGSRDVAIFVPIQIEDRVIGVLGIGSSKDQREEMLRHIDAMRPMLDQVAFALDHALLYRASQDYTRVIVEANSALEREISERKRAEEAVVRLERLGALVEMSEGVSHNLNNILTGVLGPAELIGRMTDRQDILREADLIRTSALRARDLVMRLHESARWEQETVSAVDLDRVVDEAIEAGKPRWKDEPESQGRQIKLIRDLNSEVMIGATGPGLQDLVLNLLFNAADALRSGGTIHVTTTKAEGGGMLTISDNGIGMDDKIRRRVFEPFFTTKMDVGTGLGLSMVYGQVTRWSGSIDVRSESGQGTTFEIDLPVWEGDAPSSSKVLPETRSGSILVVEDEEVVRDVVGRVLGVRHEVQVAEDGKSALQALEDGSFDVVLIDLGMPDMPGDRVAEKIRARDPCVATVLMTGWSLAEDDPRRRFFDLHIQKPFSNMAALLRVVDRAIQIRDQRSGVGDDPGRAGRQEHSN